MKTKREQERGFVSLILIIIVAFLAYKYPTVAKEIWRLYVIPTFQYFWQQIPH